MVVQGVGISCASRAAVGSILINILLFSIITARHSIILVSSINVTAKGHSFNRLRNVPSYRNPYEFTSIRGYAETEHTYGPCGRTFDSLAYVNCGPPLGVKNFKCGEIVLGIPTQRNSDGTIDVDIGAESPLVVAKESLMFLNNDENQRLQSILSSQMQTERSPRGSIDELVEETVKVAREVPERKRQTYLRPKLIYAEDYKREKDGHNILSYSLGVGGELTPRQLAIPRVTGKKQQHCWFRDDQMEFLVTDINTYTNEVKGEIWSESIVECKRQAYNAMAIEAIKPTTFISPYSAVIKERDGDLLVLGLTDENMEGFNAYALALPKDSPGDRVMVYLAAADPGLQHLYFTRQSISHEMLREENLKMLYDEMVYHYVKTGKWFRAVFEEDHSDSLQLRVAGKQGIESDYTAQLFLSQTPYFSPEGLLNETFKRLYTPNEYFCYNDIMINIGKLNYSFHYDSGLYVRILEYKAKSPTLADRSSNSPKNVEQLEVTTVNVCNPNGQLEEIFKKLTEQNIDSMSNLKLYSTYPAMIIGQDDGFVYFAINYTRKDNFTLDDDYFVGIMKIVPKSKHIPVGSIVNARIANITQNQVNMHYLLVNDDNAGCDSLQYTAFTYWLAQQNKDRVSYGLSRFEEQRRLSLIWMDGVVIPPPGSPHYDKFLAVQPIITESASVAQMDESLAPFVSFDRSEHSGATGESLAPVSLTKSFLNVMNQRAGMDRSSMVPIDMANFGSYTIKYEDNPDEAVAPPSFYLHNRDIRRCLIEEELNKTSLWKFKRTLEMAMLNTEGEIKSFFYNSRGRSLYEFLESLSDPITRRKITPKEALFFEQSVKVLLSGLQDFYLESIYDKHDREKLVFASIVPRSGEDGDYLYMDELEKYINYVKYDFVMNKETRDSLQRLLRILSHPNNSLLAHMRNRHRNIPDNVFYSYRKTLHYETWVDYIMPEAELAAEDKEEDTHFGSSPPGTTPMPPISELAQNPEALPTHLLDQGLSQVKGLYSILMKFQRIPKSQQFEETLYNEKQDMEERADDYIEPEDVDMEVDDMFMTDGKSEATAAAAAQKESQQNKRITSKEWRTLNKFPTGFDREALKQYIRDIKMFKPVHGVRLPML
ncbi:hypothetical protein BgAZ_109500 [Babesia gibsoni]|uniref:Uncharacterized protein n=1 Tax=Babesia gibsoni TaxID=33632 RepID=A0AAD8PGQ2_BABGI|nr:hypothetical protein BgAZ_109500 [Babesia gibsoni]